MNSIYPLRLTPGYKGQVAGLLLPLKSCFTLKYWVPLSSDVVTGVTVFVRDVDTREALYEKHFAVPVGEVLLEGQMKVGEQCHLLEFIVIADDFLTPPTFVASQNNNLTLQSLVW